MYRVRVLRLRKEPRENAFGCPEACLLGVIAGIRMGPSVPRATVADFNPKDDDAPH